MFQIKEDLSSKGKRPKILIAPSALKGTLRATAVAETIAAVLGENLADWAPELRVCPIADGGDGTLEVLQYADPDFQRYDLEVMGPLAGQRLQASYLLHPSQNMAVVEAAQAHGMAQLPPGVLAPLESTSYGVGEMLYQVIKTWPGVETVFLTVGGSASTDGGVGALQALGAQVFDREGVLMQAPITGADLIRIDQIQMPTWHKPLRIATDVINPMLGPTGTAAVYAPQKGATPSQVKDLAEGLSHLATLMEGAGSLSVAQLPRTGAAGGLAYGLSWLPGTQLISGFDWVADRLRLSESLSQSDLLVTAEGRFDQQSLSGKGSGRLITWSEGLPNPLPVIVLCGQQAEGLSLPPWVSVLPWVQPDGLEGQHALAEAMADPQAAVSRGAKQAAAQIRAIFQFQSETSPGP